MLETFDVLVYDIQDVGSRYYTFPLHAGLPHRGLRRAGKRLVVLDRPDPLGGEIIEGQLAPRYGELCGLLSASHSLRP